MEFNLFSNSICVTQQRRNAVKYRLSHPRRHGPGILQCPVRPARHACVLSSFLTSPRERIVTADPKSFQFGKAELSDKRARVSLRALMGRSAGGSFIPAFRPSTDKRSPQNRSRAKVDGDGENDDGSSLARLQRERCPLCLSCTNLPV